MRFYNISSLILFHSSFLSSCPLFIHPSFLPFSMPSFRLSFMPFLMPSFRLFFHSFCLPYVLPSFAPSFLRPFFLSSSVDVDHSRGNLGLLNRAAESVCLVVCLSISLSPLVCTCMLCRLTGFSHVCRHPKSMTGISAASGAVRLQQAAARLHQLFGCAYVAPSTSPASLPSPPAASPASEAQAVSVLDDIYSMCC